MITPPFEKCHARDVRDEGTEMQVQYSVPIT